MIRITGLALALVATVAFARQEPTPPAKNPAPAGEAAKEVRLNFEDGEVGKLPKDFTAARTGTGEPSVWVIAEDKTASSGKKVLAQTNADATEMRFPVCVYDPVSSANVEVGVRFKTVSGKVDQAAGVVARYQDENNYYLTRANVLESNVRLYKVVNGKREQLASAMMEIPGATWQTLKLVVNGPRLEVYLNDKRLLEANDTALPAAGKVGLWTKSDSVTFFDDVVIRTLP